MITNCKKNIMGTLSFDGKFRGMNKASDFIVYPMNESTQEIWVQSDTRFGIIDLSTGFVTMSPARKQYANSLWLSMALATGSAVFTQFATEDLQTLRQWIKSTGGLLVGSSVIKTDNTGAMAL